MQKALIVEAVTEHSCLSENLKELKALALTIDIEAAAKITVNIKNINPVFYIGTGKAAEIIDMAKEAEADIIIFDNYLSPSQQRNWERVSGLNVMDRQEIILEIFSRRAATKEAELQTELAVLEYSLPRLLGAWSHLSKQRGGIFGTKGEGETQLELDRRKVQARIYKIKQRLGVIKKQRQTQRKERKIRQIPICSIVGYTNAGKSSLLNMITNSDVAANDRLFDTLTTTSRKMRLKNGQEIIFSDTVGFIKNLPHQLIEAFKSTLEEAADADIILHLIDGSSPMAEEHFKTSIKVLEEINAEKNKIITVFNKIDKIQDPFTVNFFRNRYPEALFISVQEKTGIEALLDLIGKRCSQNHIAAIFKIPFTDFEIINRIRRSGIIIEEKYLDNHAVITASVPPYFADKIKKYKIKTEE